MSAQPPKAGKVGVRLHEAAVQYAAALGTGASDSEIEEAQAQVLEAALAHGRAVICEQCDAEHRLRPDAKCSSKRGHDGYHAWTRTADCHHPRFHRNPPECTACGVIRYEPVAAEEAADV